MVIMSAATGGAAARVFKAPAITVVTTDFNMGEVKRHLPPLIDKYGIDPDDVADALASLPLRIYRWDEYESHLAEARAQMEWKDPKDVALLALSLKLGIDVWSQDLHYDALAVKRTTGIGARSLLCVFQRAGADALADRLGFPGESRSSRASGSPPRARSDAAQAPTPRCSAIAT